MAHTVRTDGTWTAEELAGALGPKIATGTPGFSAAQALTFT